MGKSEERRCGIGAQSISAYSPFLLALFLTSVVVAQPPKVPTRLEHLSAVAKSQPDFYGAIATLAGATVNVAWELSAQTVELGGTVRLTFTVRNAVNPRELTRPSLAALKDHFSQIDDVPRAEPAADAKAVSFEYVLRPRTEGKIEFSPPKYRYYKPSAPGKEMQTTFVEPLSLTVTKPVVKVAPPVPLAGPESFFSLSAGLRSGSGSVPGSYWLALLIAAPLALFAWVFLWRWMFPDAARLARLRRNRAVRRTLDRLRAAPRAADPAGETATAFRHYLCARFGLPVAANTPGEVRSGLQELELSADRVAEVDSLLRRCDADRFAPVPTPSATSTDAIRLVLAWERGSP